MIMKLDLRVLKVLSKEERFWLMQVYQDNVKKYYSRMNIEG